MRNLPLFIIKIGRSPYFKTAAVVVMVVGLGLSMLQTRRPVKIDWEDALSGPSRSIAWAIVPHPDDPTRLFVGTNGGVYESSDNGKTWISRTLGLSSFTGETEGIEPALHIRDLLFSGLHKGRLCLATWGAGIYCSKDAGRHWEMNQGPVGGAQLNADRIRDWVHVRVLVETDQTMFAGTRSGVLRLMNLQEKLWSVAGLLDMEIRALVAHPVYTQTLYAGTWDHGIYKSENDGLTWQPKNAGLEGDALDVNRLVFDSTNPDVMYAGTFGRGVYRSTDAGEHWYTWTKGLPEHAHIWSLSFGPDGTLFAGLRYEGTYKRAISSEAWQPAEFRYDALTLVMDPRTDALYAGTWGGGIYHNAGGTDTAFEDWMHLGVPADYFDLSRARFVGQGSALLYVSTMADGIYVSPDGGESWMRQSQGLQGESLTVWSLAASPDGQTVYAGTGNGVFFQPGSDESWHPVGDRGPRNAIALAAAHTRSDGDIVYAGTRQNGLWKIARGSSSISWEGPLPFMYRTGVVITTTHLSSLLVEDGRVYAGVWGSGLHRSPSSEISAPWPPVEMAPKYVGNLAFANKTVWQWGGERFYATTERGLYGSRNGEDWEALPLGSVKALAVDPKHPQVVYASLLTAGSPDVGETEKITYTSEIMVSLNDGQMWQSTGALPAYVTHVACDPDNPQRLVALVADGGLYRGQVSLPWLGREVAVAWLLGLAACGLLVIMPWRYANLLYTYRLSHRHALGLLAHLPRLYRIRSQQTRKSLKPLAKLILATVDDSEFRLVDVWGNLHEIGVVTSRDRLVEALDELLRYGFIEKKEDNFVFVTPGLQNVALVEFQGSDDRLLEGVRYENRLLNDVGRFFDAAGFDVRQGNPLNLTKFLLRPRRSLYRDYRQLHAWLKIEGTLHADDVDKVYREIEVRDDPMATGHDADALTPLAFFIGVEMPDALAFRQMWMYQDRLRLVPISLTMIRSALRGHSAARDLDRLVQQSNRRVDLYDLRSPVIDRLDFFGRQDTLERVSIPLEKGQSVNMWGLPSMGKTSLLWCLKETLVNPIVAYFDFSYGWQDSDEFQAQIMNDLSRDLWLKYDRFFEIEGGCDFEHQLQSIVEAVPINEAWQARVVLLLDGASMAAGGEQQRMLDVLRHLADTQSYFALVTTWRDAVPPIAVDQVLPPLREQACTTLVLTLGARMGMDFAPDSLARIYQETGGHPFLLRQLGSAIARQVPAAHAPPDSLKVTLAWVDRVQPAYLSMRRNYFEEVWQWLAPDQREVLRTWDRMTHEERERELTSHPCLRSMLQRTGRLSELFRAWIIAEVQEDRL